MQAPESKTIHRSDYRPYTHSIDSVELDFVLDPDSTLVTSNLLVTPRRGATSTDLVLDAQDLFFERLLIDGQPASADRYSVSDTQLVVHDVSKQTRLTIVNRFSPKANTRLSGIYMSNGAFMSQCEAEGFRRITYWPDRPDVMSQFTVTIHADKQLYPIMLSNGNYIDGGLEGEDRHWMRWQDPFKKPSYLFALVAGQFVSRSEQYTLANGKTVTLEVWTEEKNYPRSQHALDSLKRAIAWDEQRFGLELDLERFMIVATDDFNFGAMENKGLNIFNSRYVMASPELATDADYDAIESVVGHEYFHNWTGDRVTCRDWFQLTLKEGLTVFRDQEFSMDMAGDPASRAVKRIADVRRLRQAQFPEDAGPMAHPIRPESYQEINNFYTTTVYEKGAEVIRMLQTILGIDGFRRGMDTYIARHDGCAVTCNDFIRAMADANQVDLSQFSLWWSQAGTPRVMIETQYDPNTFEYTIRATQSTPATPGQEKKQPLVIPIRVGLINSQGQDMLLRQKGAATACETQHLLLLTSETDAWTFENVLEKPLISIGREFSAPVIFDYPYNHQELSFLSLCDSDPFNRAEAFERLVLDVLDDLVTRIECGMEIKLPEVLTGTFIHILRDDTLSPQYRACILTPPTEKTIASRRALINPDAVRRARRFYIEQIGHRFSQDLSNCVNQNLTLLGYSPNPTDAGKRALKNLAMSFWLAGGNTKALITARDQFDNADNLTDQLAALKMIVDSQSPAKIDVLNAAAQLWRAEPLLLNKWFTVQATTMSHPGECAVQERVRALMNNDIFKLANPNNVYALLLAFFTQNEAEFHRADGSGYRLWVEMVLKLDAINTHTAARLARALDNWRRYSPDRARLMHQALTEVAEHENLSSGVREIVEKALAHA